MGKILKVIKAVGSTASGTVDSAVSKESNNLLLLVLIVIVWIYLFFSKGDGNSG